MVAVSVTIMFTLWSCLFYHTWSCHLLLWYLVVLGIVSIFVVVIVSFHFILWCIVVVGQYQFSLLGLVHEGVEGVVKGVHEVGVMDWRLSACEKYVIGLEIKQDNFVEYVEWTSRSGSHKERG